jgi:arginase
LQVHVVEVPYAVGDERHDSASGADHLVESGLEHLLTAKGVTVASERIERGAPFADSTSASRAVNERVASAVRNAIAADRLPLVIAGSCDVAIGTLGGFDHSRCGVVWIDAHADFNTPDSTVSGFFPGMTLAVVTGHCYSSLWAQIGESTPVPETSVVLIGVRDFSPEEEQARLERSGVRAVRWLDGRPETDVEAALDDLALRVPEVYVHLDLDGLDPELAPGIVDDPVPGGLTLTDLERAIRSVRQRFRIRAAAVTTFNPELDQGDKTLRAAQRAVELLVTSA